MKIQLCLSGGGARGFAHLGAIAALQEMGFEISRISGTSAGAMAGSFMAAGYDPAEMLELFIQKQIFKMFRGVFNKGLLKMDGMASVFGQYLPEEFSGLKIPMIIAATDILSGKIVYLQEGLLLPAIVGSSSIPGLFRPVKFQGMLLVDGGVLNNLPVEPLRKYTAPIIGVHVNPVGEITAPSTTWGVLERTFHLGVFSNTVYREAFCDFLIEPADLKQTKVFDYKKAREIYKAGYNHVKKHADELLLLGSK
ncbi:MAG: patatin-like phospholipase family protein [Bacteroidia bacterium]|nr:patatin-like phospholipase family protein [Bacteroidia bacterium]